VVTPGGVGSGRARASGARRHGSPVAV